MKRYLRGYDRKTEALVHEIPLSEPVDLENLRRLFGVPDDDPLIVDCYPLTGSVLAYASYDYFLECDA